MKTLADFRRAAVPGSRWQCTNYKIPHVSGLRIVTGGKATLRYNGTKDDGTEFTNSYLQVPKANAVRICGDSIHFLYEPGGDQIAFTWTLLADQAAGQ